MILYQSVVRMSKELSFDDAVHFTDEKNMVTYADFDGGFMFLPETPTKIRQINRERFPDPVKNPNAFPATINIPVVLISRVALMFF